MTRKHWEHAAELVKKSDLTPHEQVEVARLFADFFSHFAPSFDRGRFYRTIGFADAASFRPAPDTDHTRDYGRC